ncbi:MAG: DUF2948 family protein [Alphaproteobacteria bacterium]|nr:DUF2948 family protein [Alphaproteobacteria bacterium]
MANKEQQNKQNNKTSKADENANKQALHLIARDVDDLNLISALLQDAVLLAHDMVWDENARIFALMVNRFLWEEQSEKQTEKKSEKQGEKQGGKQTEKQGETQKETQNARHKENVRHKKNARIRTGVHFHGVTNVQNRGIKQHSQQVLSLLALQFEPHKTLTMPAGYIRFVFSAGAELRLTVEALNVIMQDVTASWPTAHRPKHE